jgi:hypothetical protein
MPYRVVKSNFLDIGKRRQKFVLQVDRIGRMEVVLVKLVVTSFLIALEIFPGLVDPLCTCLYPSVCLWKRVVTAIISSESPSNSSSNDMSMTFFAK